MWTFIWLMRRCSATPRWQGADRPADPAGLARQSVGARRPRARGAGRDPADRDDAADEAVGRAGARRSSATATSSSAAATPSSCCGRFPFSRFIANVSGSRSRIPGSSPSRTASRSSTTRPRRASAGSRFCVWVLDNAGPFGVKRLKPEYQRTPPRPCGYCRGPICRQVALRLRPEHRRRRVLLRRDDREGVSLTTACRCPSRSGSATWRMSRSIPICVIVFLKLSNLSLDQPVFFPGNERHGIWSSPRLVTVYESKPTPDEQTGWFGATASVECGACRDEVEVQRPACIAHPYVLRP